MSGTVSTATQQSNAMSAAITATQQAATNASSSSTSSSSSSATTTAASSQNALADLSGNFTDFLDMLMTQLQNQDPTSPMDTNEFTSELVEFAGVEQQIDTNNSLTQLIQLTQGNEVIDGAEMDGEQVQVTSSQIPLQNGTGSVQFTAPTAEPVAIAISNSSGEQVLDTSLNATAGQNTWTWNGTDSSGNQVADGAYYISVIGGNSDGTTTALSFTVGGTVTGVENSSSSTSSSSSSSSSSTSSSSSSGVELELGGVTVPFSSIVSVDN